MFNRTTTVFGFVESLNEVRQFDELSERDTEHADSTNARAEQILEWICLVETEQIDWQFDPANGKDILVAISKKRGTKSRIVGCQAGIARVVVGDDPALGGGVGGVE